MDNTAKTLLEAVATNDSTISNALATEIVEREAYIEQHPNEWISAEESIIRLRERRSRV